MVDLSSDDELKKAGFEGFLSVAALRKSNLAQVPKEPGVYLFLATDSATPQFNVKGTGGFFKNRDPNVAIDELSNNWVHGALIVNIGKAGGGRTKATLQGRLRQYLKFGDGSPSGITEADTYGN